MSRQHVDDILIALYKNQIVGFVMGVHYGRFRHISPIVLVLPKYWNNGIRAKLLNQLLEENNEHLTHDLLSTYLNTYHIKYYGKLIWISNTLFATCSINDIG